MGIGLIQVDGKLPNLALMKISSFYKRFGEKVEFTEPGKKYEKVFASCLFSWNRDKALQLRECFPSIEIGGTGLDLSKSLPPEIEKCRPDYNLYTAEMIYDLIKRGIRKAESTKKKAIEIANMGIGVNSRSQLY